MPRAHPAEEPAAWGPVSTSLSERRAWLVRHARTAASAEHRLNGRPEAGVELDAVGLEQCGAARGHLAVGLADVCVVSAFPRARQTARLLMAGRDVPVLVDARLNELDYGVFEGGPFWDYGTWLTGHGIHARPPGAAESQREGLLRMTAALCDALARPGRPLVIGHGLLVSVLALVGAGGSATAQVFPEAGYVVPLAFTDTDLAALRRDLATSADADGEQPPGHDRPEKPARVVTVEGGRRRVTLPP